MTTHEFDRPTVDYKLLRTSAALLFGGIVVTIVAGVLHPSHEIPNDHTAVFAEYASSSSWTAAHLGQFVGMAILIAGLLTLFFAFNVRSGMAGWSGRLGAVAASAALALYGVLQAVDGVALKQAVDAWASAPEAEKAARFAAAEAVRWLEWGSRSYQSFTLGLALLLFAMMIVATAMIPRAVGYLMALTGVAYLVQGWVLGTEGFSETNALPTLLGYVLFIAFSFWLLIVALRMKRTDEIPAGQLPMGQGAMAE